VVIAMLRQPEGATVDEVAVAAGSLFTASAKRKFVGTKQMITTNSGAHPDSGADHFCGGSGFLDSGIS
jgi:hypothetical protein